MAEVRKSINVDNENRIISYLMRHPIEVAEVKTEYFLSLKAGILYKALSDLNDKKLPYSHETLTLFVREYSNDINYDEIKTVFDIYDDFENIKLAFDTLKSDWLKFNQFEKTLQLLSENLSVRGNVDAKALKQYAEDLLVNIAELDPEKQLYTTPELADIYMGEMTRRRAGIAMRSLGYETLDSIITKPAAAGEITILFADSGSGKSVFTLGLSNILINRGVCLLSVNTEMSTISNLDRLICIRQNIPLYKLLATDIESEIEVKYTRALDYLKKQKNFLYVNADSYNFARLDYHIGQAQSAFFSAGVLPSDGYMLVTVDLLSILEDFGDLSPTSIEKAMNVLHRIVRKHNVHVFGVIQGNENKIRNMKMFKNPSEIDSYRIGLEDIKGGAAYKERARVVIGLHRPLFMKKKYFPEMRAIWDNEQDVVHVNLLKQNDGDIGYAKMVLIDNFRIANYLKPATPPMIGVHDDG